MATITATTLIDELDGGASAEALGGAGLSLREALALAQDGERVEFVENLDGVIRIASGRSEMQIEANITIDGDNRITITGDVDDNDIVDDNELTDAYQTRLNSRASDNEKIFSIGNGGNDSLRCNGGDDTLRGNGGTYDLRGNGGADVIRAGGGGDTVRGNGGADKLLGQGGDDSLHGNGGRDVFQFRTSDRNDTILDYTQGQDSIEILNGVNRLDALVFEQDFRDVLISFGAGQIRVVTDNVGAFTEDDFIF